MCTLYDILLLCGSFKCQCHWKISPQGQKSKNSPREICPRASVRTRCRDILKPSLVIPQITNRLSTSKVPQTLNQGSGSTMRCPPPLKPSSNTLISLPPLPVECSALRVEIGSVPSRDARPQPMWNRRMLAIPPMLAIHQFPPGRRSVLWGKIPAQCRGNPQ